jgi:hypothetical protein
VMTLCRGPWLGAGVAAVAVALGMARNRKRAIALVAIVLALASMPAYYAVKSYVSVSREGAATQSQETAAYRREILETYVTVVENRPTLGYGRDFPRDGAMNSVDNNYLLLALTHGVYALLAFVTLFIWMSVRLARLGVRLPREDASASLAFTMFGVYLAFAVSIATVYLGLQAIPLLAMVTGWSEGMILAPVRVPGGAKVFVPIASGPFRFERVMA